AFPLYHPALATYRNHAYVLSTRPVEDKSDSVYFTTNESGAWTTQLLSADGPDGRFYLDDRTSLAIDPTTKRLYAMWVHRLSETSDAGSVLVLWTREASGTWHGPTTLFTGHPNSGQSSPASMVVADGKAYVAFVGRGGEACSTHADDDNVMPISYDGSQWSPPRNLTSCVAAGHPAPFLYPKLALDGGHLYLVSAVLSQSWDLFYMDNVGGSWSPPRQITRHRIGTSTRGSGGMFTPFDYSIAASR